jgi:hypothetical protein
MTYRTGKIFLTIFIVSWLKNLATKVRLHQDTNRSDQPAPGTEDIKMQAPPTNTAEVAVILFAEMEKHMTNGKHINYIP